MDETAVVGVAVAIGVVLSTGLGGGATGSGCADIAHPASKPMMENDQNNRWSRMAAKLAPDLRRIEIKQRHRGDDGDDRGCRCAILPRWSAGR
jgi:hypothetical protein